MAKQSRKDKTQDQIIFSGFNTLITLLSIMVIIIIMSLGYILLEDSIDNYLNRPQFSEIQRAALQKRSKKRQGENQELVKNGIHLSTGMAYDENFKVVRAACTYCHSPKLITQNRATRDGWQQMIRWMQKTQGLWELGVNEPIILDYLEKKLPAN